MTIKYFATATDPRKALKLEIELDSDSHHLWEDLARELKFAGDHEFDKYKDGTVDLWQWDPVYYFRLCEVVLLEMQGDWVDEDLEDLAQRIDNYRSEKIDVCWKINIQGQWERLVWNDLESQHPDHRNLDFDKDWYYLASLVEILEDGGRDAFWQEIMRRLVAGGEEEFNLLDAGVRVNCWKELEEIKRDAVWQPEWVALTRSYEQHLICERDHPRMTAIWTPEDYRPTPEQAQSFVSELNQIASGEVYSIWIDGEHECGGFVMGEDAAFQVAKGDYPPDDVIEITKIQYDAVVFLRDLEENKAEAEKILQETQA